MALCSSGPFETLASIAGRSKAGPGARLNVEGTKGKRVERVTFMRGSCRVPPRSTPRAATRRRYSKQRMYAGAARRVYRSYAAIVHRRQYLLLTLRSPTSQTTTLRDLFGQVVTTWMVAPACAERIVALLETRAAARFR